MSEKHYVVCLHKGFDKEEIINDLNRDTTLDSNVDSNIIPDREVQNVNTRPSFEEWYKEHESEVLALHYVVGQSEQLKALEDLKDFAYDNCQPHNSDRLAEIMERL